MADTNFITAEKIKGIIENQIIDNKDFVSTKKFKTYDFSYEKLLKIFENLKSDQKDKQALENWLIGGSSIIYSWMPTILNFSKGSDDDEKANTHLKECIKALKLIEGKKNEYDRLLKDESFYNKKKKKEGYLYTLTSFINNSIVGTSKFLHFSFPEHFPIWDSRVEKATRFDVKNPTSPLNKSNHRTKKVDNYIAYCKAVNELISKYPAFLKDIDGKLDGEKKEHTPIRKIENALFIIGGK